MLRDTTFHLMMTPTSCLEVRAVNMSAALAVARDALPFLQAREAAPIVAGEDGYELSCLVCGLVNPEQYGRSPLVALQEHQMEAHGLGPDDFSQSVRIAHLTEERTCYVWALPSERAAALQLSQLSYMHAAQGKPRGESAPSRGTQEANITLVFKQGGDMAASVQSLCLMNEDALAWYGYPQGGSCSGELCAWPKGEWRLHVLAIPLEAYKEGEEQEGGKNI
jgi:hypothetical protein